MQRDLDHILAVSRVAYGRVSTLEDVVRHPQNRYVEVGTPTGPVRCLAPGVVFDDMIPQFGPVPSLGEHSDSIRAKFVSRKLASA